MNYFLNRSIELFDETVKNRRYIHQNAEYGMELPKTVAYVVNQLRSYGYDNIEKIGGGVTCSVGHGDKVLLLRADMDALKQNEETGLPYACTNGACHSCGHDIHTAMLLTAAKMLKEKENELCNVVKFMFQPGEEVPGGAKAMIQAGILENPHVDYAMAVHVLNSPMGSIRYSYSNSRAFSAFTIKVHGKGCHGGKPFMGVNAATVAANIVTISHQILSYEIAPGSNTSLTVGMIQSGSAANILPGEALLTGTLRSNNTENMAYLKQRLSDIVKHVSAALRATAEIKFDSEINAVINNKELVDEFLPYFEEVSDDVALIPEFEFSDDFAEISVEVPSMFVFIGSGSPEEGYIYPGHNPKCIKGEESMKAGAAAYANCAFRWANK